jgi:hypothetical protein
MINEFNDVYFISGDKIFFQEDVKQVLKDRVMRTINFIKMMKVLSPIGYDGRNIR